ncbi:hypothetical protein SKAU_G00427810 [Synaphobranchus kaupii]|uniref:Uncharacterized protein n=1 Tax=Synaphobranchus kaupii TaxID=118154 RepID=A0A9Q1IA49_SYNKA|nr:hypothetical protein SKAU_G00427810 [Synaphobranchus kaupii]
MRLHTAAISATCLQSGALVPKCVGRCFLVTVALPHPVTNGFTIQPQCNKKSVGPVRAVFVANSGSPCPLSTSSPTAHSVTLL